MVTQMFLPMWILAENLQESSVCVCVGACARVAEIFQNHTIQNINSIGYLLLRFNEKRLSCCTLENRKGWSLPWKRLFLLCAPLWAQPAFPNARLWSWELSVKSSLRATIWIHRCVKTLMCLYVSLYTKMREKLVMANVVTSVHESSSSFLY